MSKRTWWWLGLAALVLGAVGLGVARCSTDVRLESNHSVESFCLTFDPLYRSVGTARQAIRDVDSTDPVKASTATGMAQFFWTKDAAAGAPAELRADAELVVAGVRRALDQRSVAPTETRAFTDAVRRLAPKVAQVCKPYRR